MATGITKRDLAIPPSAATMAWHPDKPLAFVLHNVYSKQECQDFIQQAEGQGFEEALVNIGDGRQKSLPNIRSSARCIWDNPEKTDDLWGRIRQYIPEVWRDRKVLGLNERLRILRYDGGGYFKPHRDGVFTRDNGERSQITVQIYLNEGYQGGSTTFIDGANIRSDRTKGPLKGDVPLLAKTGDVLVFEHPLMHEGSQLFKGRKYTIRTDVMYSAEKLSGSGSSAST